MTILNYHTTCTPIRPQGAAQPLEHLGQSAQAATPLSTDDDLIFSLPSGSAVNTEAASLANLDEWQAPALDFNTLKQSKHIIKALGTGLKESGYKEAGDQIKDLSRLVGVVGHSGRAYEKLQKSQYLDAGKEGARAIKDGSRLIGKTLPAGLNHGLNLVITAAVAEKFYDYLMAAIEDPSYENLDRFVAHSKLAVQNVDDVYELSKFLINFAQQQGPDFSERLRASLQAGEGNLEQLSAASAGAGWSLAQVSATVIAGLDVGRAVLAGVEAVKDPESDEKLGQVLKRSVVAGFSLASARQNASWVPSVMALGTELVPNMAYTYVAREARSYYHGL